MRADSQAGTLSAGAIVEAGQVARVDHARNGRNRLQRQVLAQPSGTGDRRRAKKSCPACMEKYINWPPSLIAPPAGKVVILLPSPAMGDEKEKFSYTRNRFQSRQITMVLFMAGGPALMTATPGALLLLALSFAE